MTRVRRLSATTIPASLCAVAILLASPLFAAAQGVLLTPPANTTTPVSRLFMSLASFVGDDPQDCGRTASELRLALACAEAASGAHRPFRLYARRPGTTFAATGLIGTADGRIWRFTYDTSACASQDCFGQLSVTRCVGPQLTRSSDGADVWSCASEPAEPAEPIEAIERPPLQIGSRSAAIPATERCSGTVSRRGPGPDLDAAWLRVFVARL